MAMIELVDFNTIYVKGGKAAEAKKTRRSRRGGSTAAKVTTKQEMPAAEATPTATDDLTKIEGIGPKIAEALHKAGIVTFTDLSGKSAEEVKDILNAAEGHFSMADPTTWAQQADLAANGKWDDLKTLQEELKGGKKVDE
ncbi:MAG TPA: helix-hairpin-helix domain-containing protein [Edaphocola sp.]|nr:helix-hairpin-helix domain-containing protein [Edaphocola sp.]